MRATFSRLWSIALKELLQLRRDRLTLAMMVALPVVQLMLFGYAIDTDVRHIPTVVYDQDRSAQSRDFAAGMQATGFYDLVGEVRGYEEISRALRSGSAHVALVVPSGYASDLLRGRGADSPRRDRSSCSHGDSRPARSRWRPPPGTTPISRPPSTSSPAWSA